MPTPRCHALGRKTRFGGKQRERSGRSSTAFGRGWQRASRSPGRNFRSPRRRSGGRRRTPPSISRSWTRRRISAWRKLGFFAALGARPPERASFSPAISASAFSSSRSPGRRWASTFGALPHARDQLPHVAPNPHSGGRAAGPKVIAMWTETPRTAADTISVFDGPPPAVQIAEDARRDKRLWRTGYAGAAEGVPAG